MRPGKQDAARPTSRFGKTDCLIIGPVPSGQDPLWRAHGKEMRGARRIREGREYRNGLGGLQHLFDHSQQHLALGFIRLDQHTSLPRVNDP